MEAENSIVESSQNILGCQAAIKAIMAPRTTYSKIVRECKILLINLATYERVISLNDLNYLFTSNCEF